MPSERQPETRKGRLKRFLDGLFVFRPIPPRPFSGYLKNLLPKPAILYLYNNMFLNIFLYGEG